MNDRELLKLSLEIAYQSHIKNNLPFGCVLADQDGNLLASGENTVITDEDPIAHCEINLVHSIAGKYSPAFLSTCTLYASTEPCPMCAAAIFWSGIGRLVFAIGKEQFHQIAKTEDHAHRLEWPAATLLERSGRKVKVEGPLLEKEAIEFYSRIYQ